MQAGKKQHSNITLKIKRNGKKITLKFSRKLIVPYNCLGKHNRRDTVKEKRNSIDQSRNQVSMFQQHRAEAWARQQNIPEQGFSCGQATAN